MILILKFILMQRIIIKIKNMMPILTMTFATGNLKLIILNFQYFESPRQKRRKVYCLARKRKVMESSATEVTSMKSSVSFSLPPVWMMSLTSKDHDKECSNLTWNKVQTHTGERGRG